MRKPIAIFFLFLLYANAKTMAQQEQIATPPGQATAKTPQGPWAAPISQALSNANKELVRQFIDEVRSGKNPDKTASFMADTVLAHQENAEGETIVKRTPGDYADHVRDFLRMYGKYSFEITELIAENDKVYVRWKQTGRHLAEIDGHPPTGKPLVEIASAVYRVKNNRIAEYWIQIDRLGFEKQLQ